jgi:hypothetical protein
MKLTERDLSRIVRRVINEQDETNTNFCEIAEVDQNILNLHLKLNDDLNEMIKKLNSMSFDCDLDKAMVFTMMFDKIYDRFGALMQLSVKGVDVDQYVEHLKNKYNLL